MQRKPSASSVDRPANKRTLSVSMKSTFQRPKGSQSSKQMIPMYVNVTGPGDYTIHGFADSSFGEADSNKRNAPRYSLAPKTKQPYWPQYEVDFKG